jgi:hypothetical protein
MTTSEPREVLLLGSVAMDSAEAVMRTAATALGTRLKRIPDGETGPARSLWIQCQTPFFLGHPQLEMVEPDPANPGAFRPARIPSVGLYSPTMVGGYRGMARLCQGVSPTDLHFDNLGYADWAASSYVTFRRLRDEGIIAPGTRFQVTIPSPLFTARLRSVPDQLPFIYSAYTDGIAREVERMAASIPREDLALQWDCMEPVGYSVMDGATQQGVIARLAGLAKMVPQGVELGYHLCYGDYEHKHFEEPDDAAVAVEIANRLSSAVIRRIDWLHLPVPRERSDPAYFEPLSDLKLHPETQLYLGLVHHTGGIEGTKRRMQMASRFVSDYGIATECGMGRRPPETIDDMWRIHAEASEADV